MFTASDVRLMISMSEFIAKVSSRVAREQEMLSKSKQPGSIPIGNEKIKYIRRAGLIYLYYWITRVGLHLKPRFCVFAKLSQAQALA